MSRRGGSRESFASSRRSSQNSAWTPVVSVHAWQSRLRLSVCSCSRVRTWKNRCRRAADDSAAPGDFPPSPTLLRPTARFAAYSRCLAVDLSLHSPDKTRAARQEATGSERHSGVGDAPMRIRLVGACLAALCLPTVLASAQRAEPIQPIGPPVAVNPAMMELGKKLYFDPRLSRSGFISCNSCHNLSMGGSDNLRVSIGHNWQKGPIKPRVSRSAGSSRSRFDSARLGANRHTR